MRIAPRFWRDDGVTARLLAPIGALYGAFAGQRLTRAAPAAALPTIVIGGLTAGGDGKTPLALAVATCLIDLGAHPAFLTRGYGRRRKAAAPILVDPARHDADAVGDEALLLARRAPTIVGADRAAAAALAAHQGANVVVLDDGFHSRALAADLTLLAIDADYGVGNGRCLPAGPLRAPLAAQLAAADLLALIGEGDKGAAIARRAGKPVVTATVVAAGDALIGRQVVAFAGVARPDKFFRSLRHLGAYVVATLSFADHRRFSPRDVARLSALRKRHNATLVTTEKDAARLGDVMTALDIVTLPMSLAFTDRAALDAALRDAMARGATRYKSLSG